LGTFYAVSCGMALPKKFLPLTLFGIAVTSLFSVQPAQAYVVTLEQVGSNVVVANGSGPINLTGLTFSSTHESVTLIAPGPGYLQTGGTGPPSRPGLSSHFIGITGPTSFGPGGFPPELLADTASGDIVGILISVLGGEGILTVPQGYVSGSALSSTATWNFTTFASLGVTPGTYVWAWGTGLPNQNFTLVIGGTGVPDGGTTVSLLGCALLGLAALRRKSRLLRGRKS
jgi:VPDSG-CTERM motif